MNRNHTRSPLRISHRAAASGVPARTARLWPSLHRKIPPLQRTDQFLEPGYKWALACRTVKYQCHLKEIQKRCQRWFTELIPSREWPTPTMNRAFRRAYVWPRLQTNDPQSFKPGQFYFYLGTGVLRLRWLYWISHFPGLNFSRKRFALSTVL